MTQKNKCQVEEVQILRSSNKVLNGKEGYQILQEFKFKEQHYAVLRFDNNHPDDCFLYRVSGNQLEEIEDEMEWEHVSDAIDEYLFFRDSI